MTFRAESLKIVIVGSGLSGYAAAAKLMENGIKDITILEAESRTGGRINSVEIATNKYIDLGAQWVHGEKENSIFEMIDGNFKYGSSTFDDQDLLYLSSTGNVADINKEDLDTLGRVAERISHSYKTMKNFDGSLGDYMMSQYKKLYGDSKYASITNETKQQFIDFAEKGALATEAASSWFEVSAKLTATSSEAEGDEYVTWRTDGFKTVFDFIQVNIGMLFITRY